MKNFMKLFLLVGLMVIVHQNGVRIGRTLEEKEVGAENSKCNADFRIMQEEEGDTLNEKIGGTVDEIEGRQKDTKEKREPVEYRYMSDLGGPEGFLDGENTIFWKDYYRDYKTILRKSVEYHIPICLQDSLQDYFSLRDPNEDTWFPKDIYCMFYDERTIEMTEEELEILFLQNGYELSSCKGKCRDYYVRFLQYRGKDSYYIYPEHIIMQTWNDRYIYVQEITGPMERKVMDFICVDDRENPLAIVHSSSMTRDRVSEEELSFWEFNGNFWSLVPMELEVDYTEAVLLEDLKPGKEADFNPVYYPDGIVFGASGQYDPIYLSEGKVTYKPEDGNIRYMTLGKLEEIEKNKSFQLIMVEKDLYWPAEPVGGGFVKFEIKPPTE